MGLSFAISGGIIVTVVMYIMLTVPGFIDDTVLLSETATEVSQLEKKIADTVIDISSTTMSSGSDNFTFELKNEGNNKLWKYDKFNVLVTYEGVVTGSLTESLTFDENCLGSAGTWCKNSIQNDLLDPDILNEDETMIVGVTLSENIDPGVGIIAVSTDTGVITSFGILT